MTAETTFTLADLAEAFKAGERQGEDGESHDTANLGNAIYDIFNARKIEIKNYEKHIEKCDELAKRALAEWRAR